MRTERGHADEVLRKAVDRYRPLAENVSDVVFVLDVNLRHTYCSPSVERLSGYTSEEVISRTLEQVLSRDSYQLAKMALDERLAEEKVGIGVPLEMQTLELEINRKRGGTVWADVKMSFLRDRRGDIVGVLGVSRDISERRQSEEALRESEEKHRRPFQKATDPALLLDGDTFADCNEALLTTRLRLSEAMDLAKIVYWELDWTTETFIFNDAFYAFYGTTPEREGGYRMTAEQYRRSFVHPDDWTMVQESAQRNRVGRDPEFLVDLEHRIIRRNGEVRHILARTRGFRDSEGRIVRCYGANQDITARKRAEVEREVLESRLRQNQKMEAIGTLSAGIAHDFKNILTAIGGFANLGIKYAQGDSEAKRHLDRISRAVERGKDLVGQILAFGHKEEDETGPADLVPVVKESVRMLRASLHPSILVKTEFAIGSSPVLADPTQLQQIIVNMANNAAYAMKKRGGTLTIGLSDVSLTPQNRPAPDVLAGDYVRLSVSDTGVGMDAQTVERIFDPFFTTKKRAEGTGLGLWVVHSIVKKFKGAITVRSAPGEGSTFDVFLPRVSQ